MSAYKSRSKRTKQTRVNKRVGVNRRVGGHCPMMDMEEEEGEYEDTMMGGGGGGGSGDMGWVPMMRPVYAAPAPVMYRPIQNYTTGGHGKSCGPSCPLGMRLRPSPPRFSGHANANANDGRQGGLFGVDVCVSTTTTKFNMARRLNSAISDWVKAYVNDSCIKKYPDLTKAYNNAASSLNSTLSTLRAQLDKANTKSIKPEDAKL